MLSNLLDIVANEDGNYYFDGAARGFGEACIYALIGFLIVFVGIVIIICVIYLVGLLMKKTDNLAFLFNKRTKKQSPASAATDDVQADGEIPDEVKAAIVAAIMAYYSDEKPECEFKVKKIKRI